MPKAKRIARRTARKAARTERKDHRKEAKAVKKEIKAAGGSKKEARLGARATRQLGRQEAKQIKKDVRQATKGPSKGAPINTKAIISAAVAKADNRAKTAPKKAMAKLMKKAPALADLTASKAIKAQAGGPKLNEIAAGAPGITPLTPAARQTPAASLKDIGANPFQFGQDNPAAMDPSAGMDTPDFGPTPGPQMEDLGEMAEAPTYEMESAPEPSYEMEQSPAPYEMEAPPAYDHEEEAQDDDDPEPIYEEAAEEEAQDDDGQEYTPDPENESNIIGEAIAGIGNAVGGILKGLNINTGAHKAQKANAQIEAYKARQAAAQAATGKKSNTGLYIALAAGALILVVIFFVMKKKR
jgi:hypothetical protein